MKVTKISVLEFSRELDGTAWNPVFRWHERRAPLVLIEFAEGVTGVGEGWSQYTDCRSVLAILADKVAPALINRSCAAPSDACAFLHACFDDVVPSWAVAAAISAVDIAMWDAAAKLQGVPLWRFLGGSDGSAPVYASGGLYRDGQDLESLETEFQRYVDRGFTSFKMKIAGVPLTLDMERVAAVRRAIGNNSSLWVDAVGQLTEESCSPWFNALAHFAPAAIQAPVTSGEVAFMRRINREILPVVAAEAEHRHDVLRGLLANKAVSHLQFCLPLCGGVTGALLLDNMASIAGVSTTPQCFSTAIAQAASLHFAAARTNVLSAEYHCFHDHLVFLCEDGLGVVRNGVAYAGAGIGLGLALPAPGLQPDGGRIDAVRVLT